MSHWDLEEECLSYNTETCCVRHWLHAKANDKSRTGLASVRISRIQVYVALGGTHFCKIPPLFLRVGMFFICNLYLARENTD
jgi:hypothetical protein